VFIGGGGYIHATASISVCCTRIVELYDSVTGTFSSPGSTPAVRGQAATPLSDGTALLAGGSPILGPALAHAGLYHPAVLGPAPVLF